MFFEKLFRRNKRVETDAPGKNCSIAHEAARYDPEKFERLCRLILCDDPENFIPECQRIYASDDCLENKYNQILTEYFACDIDCEDIDRTRSYIISSDSGAPCLTDFFWYLDCIKRARHLDFMVDPSKYDEAAAIDAWIYETARQLPLQGFHVCYFASEDDQYNFSVFQGSEGEEVVQLANALFPEIAFAEIVHDHTFFR